MKRATVYGKPGFFIVVTSSETTTGLWIEAGPYYRLSADASDEDLGSCVLSALAASTNDLPHPTDWKNFHKPVWDLAGVKSWGAFVKGASCVSVEAELDRISLTPSVNHGARDGFKARLDGMISIYSPSKLALGASVRSLLQPSEG